jgi:hypothetical protein
MVFHTAKDFSGRCGCFRGNAGPGVGGDARVDDSRRFSVMMFSLFGAS